MWSIVLLAMAGTANSGTVNRPKELTVDVGGGVKLEMVLIPAGEFMMGTPNSDQDTLADEQPQHRVRITKPFYLGKYLVTQEQWEAVMGSNRSYFKGPKNPVESVSWENCQVFLKRLHGQVGREENFSYPPRCSGNMPAGRGARRSIISGTSSRNWANMRGTAKTPMATRIRLAKRSQTPGGSTICTGTYGSGVRTGMSDGYYAHSPTDDPTGPSEGTSRAIRGASWDAPAAPPVCAAPSSAPTVGTTYWACVSRSFPRTSKGSAWTRSVRRQRPLFAGKPATR